MKLTWNILVVVGVLALTVQAWGTEDTRWTPVNAADWNVDANWTNGVPDLNKIAYVDNAGSTACVTSDAYAYSLWVAPDPDSTGIVDLQTGGTMYLSHGFYLGWGSESTGCYTMHAGTLTIPGTVTSYIGGVGTGSFDQSGGTCNVGTLIVGGIPGSGQVNPGYLVVSAGTMNMSGMIYAYRGSVRFDLGTSGQVTCTSCNIGGYSSPYTATLYAPSKNQTEYLRMTGNFSLNPKGYITCPSEGGKIKCGSYSIRASATHISGKITWVLSRDDPDGTFEVYNGMNGGFGEDNAALGGLEVDTDFHLQYVDYYDNDLRGTAGKECVFTEYLSIADTATLDVSAYYTYLPGDQTAQMNAWIADGRLFSSLGSIEAVYMPDYNWTYVTPEPASLALLALGGLAMLHRRRR